MKFLVSLVALLLSACATSTQINKSIVVVGEGTTIELAKQNAFNRAIEQEIGAVIISNVRTSNFNLVRNEILSHSSGYVDSFQIRNTQQINGVYYVTVEVVVSGSKIAERVLNAGTTNTNVEGNKLSTQFQTYLNYRESSFDFLDNVLNDFPSKAFTVSSPKLKCGTVVAEYCFKLDTYSNSVFEIPFEFRWNYNYLRALNESLKQISDPKPGYESMVIISKNPNSIMGSTDVHHFNDIKKLARIKNRFVANVSVLAEIKDHNGITIFKGCSPYAYQRIHSDSRLIIYGNDVVKGTIQVTVNKNSHDIQKLNSVRTIELSSTTQKC